MNSKTKAVIITSIIVLILLVINVIVFVSWSVFNYETGGAEYGPYLPFPIHYQISSFPSNPDISHFVWWGILSSIIFWIALTFIIYKTSKAIIKKSK